VRSVLLWFQKAAGAEARETQERPAPYQHPGRKYRASEGRALQRQKPTQEGPRKICNLAEMGRSVLRPYGSKENPGTGLKTGHYKSKNQPKSGAPQPFA